VKRITSILLQLIAWPFLGFLIIAFDELGPAIVHARNDVYVFLQWGLLTPIVVQLALRFPLFERRLRNVAIHVAGAGVLCLLRIIGEPNHSEIIARVPAPQYLSHAMSRDLLMYAAIAVAAHLFILGRRRAAAEHDASLAQAKVAEAERALLEQTVSPELIVESLDEIARCIRHEPARVEALVEHFSELLRAKIPVRE
jgi:hypothetical protein